MQLQELFKSPSLVTKACHQVGY